MYSSAALLAVAALVVPMIVGGSDVGEADPAARVATAESSGAPVGLSPAPPAPFRLLQDALQTPVQRQVRIEQRVVIRISPSPPQVRERLNAEAGLRQTGRSVREEAMEGCVPVAAIAGVQPGGSGRLLLFLRDRRVLSATLERTCTAADFYSGFYVERSADGALCPNRDRLQSRAGASCGIEQFNRLMVEGG